MMATGTYEINTVAENYKKWVRSSPPDIGTTTRNALGASLTGSKSTAEKVTTTAEKMQYASKMLNASSLSNGALMR
jgi:hypothetical protein